MQAATIVALAVALLAASAASAAAPARPHAAHAPLAELEGGVLRQLNEIRAQHGLVPLTLSAPLTASADEHTRDMAAAGTFAHPSSDGTPFWKRIQTWYGAAGYGSWSVGENLLWSSPDVDAAGALRLWMASPDHRANILDPTWREIGVAAVHVASGPGVYGGLPVTIVTTDFGARR